MEQFLLNRDNLYKQYVENELSTKDCGVLFGVSGDTILNRLKEYGIKLRGRYDYTDRRRNKLKANKNIGCKTKEYFDKIKQTGVLPENEKIRRDKIGDWSRNFKRTDEHKRKISESLKETFSDKTNHPNYGKRVSYETRQRISVGARKALQAKIKKEGYHWGHKGYKHSEETKKRLSDIQIEKFQNQFYKGKMTKLERKGYKKLDDAGVNYIPQKRFEYYLVDAYVPEHNTIIEFNGVYWHNRPEIRRKDSAKQTYFKNKGYNFIEVWEQDIDSWVPEFN